MALETTIGMAKSSKPRVEHAERSHNKLVLQLLGQALATLDDDRVIARLRIQDAVALLSGVAEGARPKHRLLTKWQMRRVEEFIWARLGAGLRFEEVARCVNLSPSYFSRAFKQTVGVAYTNYVTKQRLELAKRLLLTTDSPIAEIALACGLADQSHLTRLFSRAEGLPPRAWRRMLRDSAELSDFPEPARTRSTSSACPSPEA